MFEIMNKEKNIIVEPKQDCIRDFCVELERDYPRLLSHNVIVDLRKITIKKDTEFLVLLHVAKQHIQSKTSFVIIANGVHVDALPDELVVVPTMVEALDIIEMDEISRDLGF